MLTSPTNQTRVRGQHRNTSDGWNHFGILFGLSRLTGLGSELQSKSTVQMDLFFLSISILSA
jgi:hypothetical protein